MKETVRCHSALTGIGIIADVVVWNPMESSVPPASPLYGNRTLAEMDMDTAPSRLRHREA